jgi:chemotaxis protein MotB
MESENGTFFELGSPQPTPALKDLLKVLSGELGTLPNKISIEGHTDSKPYSISRAYDNWDLSSERANAARRIMQEQGIRPDQVSQVRGFADQRPRLPQTPDDPSNRRISVIVQYLVKDDSEVAPPDAVKRLGMTAPESAPPSALDPTPAGAQSAAAPAGAVTNATSHN